MTPSFRAFFFALAVVLLPEVGAAQVVGVEAGEALRYTITSGVTASGEPYNPERMTIAHATLPFGTLVEVRFRSRTVTARVNDRDTGGGLVRVSHGLAEKLGLPPGGGVVEVKLGPQELAYVQRRMARRPAAAPEPLVRAAPPVTGVRYTIQLAALSDAARARALAAERSGAWVQPALVNGRAVYRVNVGMHDERQAAERALQGLRAAGQQGFVQAVAVPASPQAVAAPESAPGAEATRAPLAAAPERLGTRPSREAELSRRW